MFNPNGGSAHSIEKSRKVRRDDRDFSRRGACGVLSAKDFEGRATNKKRDIPDEKGI